MAVQRPNSAGRGEGRQGGLDGTGALITYFAGYGQGLLSPRTVVEEVPVAPPTETRERVVTQT